jgi:signal recognition particle receptor subunit beta
MNIIVAGKSGVGKSSFLNYLVDKEIFQTGIGDPVTQDYFESTSFEANSITYNLFDTKGIEPTTTTECSQKIIERIDKCDESNNFFDWIHTVYYCFSAPSKRIENFEIDFIKKIQKCTGVVILLTKRDLVDESTINALQDQIKNQIGTTAQVIPVCSVEQRTRKNVSHKSGRDKVLKASFLGLWNKLAKRLPSRCFKKVFEPLTERDLSESPLLKSLFVSWKDRVVWMDSISPWRPLQRLLDLIMNSWDVIETWRIKLRTSSQNVTDLNIDFLCKFPTLGKFKNTKLNKENRNSITELCVYATIAFHKIVYEITQIDFDKIKKGNAITSKSVFDLYEKITGEKPQAIFSHKTEEAIESIRNYQFEKVLGEIDNLGSKLIESLQDMDGCLFMNSDEKEQATNDYSEYQSKIKDHSKAIRVLIDNYINTYETELYQYGQDCIRDDAYTE